MGTLEQHQQEIETQRNELAGILDRTADTNKVSFVDDHFDDEVEARWETCGFSPSAEDIADHADELVKWLEAKGHRFWWSWDTEGNARFHTA